MTDIFANQSGHPVFPAAENMKKGTWKSKGGKHTIHFTADTEHVLMELTLSCNQLCIFLSVAQILDDQPELSYAVDSELETLREPPRDPLANNEGREEKEDGRDMLENGRPRLERYQSKRLGNCHGNSPSHLWTYCSLHRQARCGQAWKVELAIQTVDEE